VLWDWIKLWMPAPLQEQQYRKPVRLRYFDEILTVEHLAIKSRRRAISRKLKLEPRGGVRPIGPSTPPRSGKAPTEDTDIRLGGSDAPDLSRSRPSPTPCNAIGLALSGGGIRSAAFCLGALQALYCRRVIESVDYLSTVSGGGYIGTCMTAAMSKTGGKFPFADRIQDRVSVQDSPAVGHLRNYSNYLLPRSQSGIRNIAEATVIILRGLIANAAFVVTTLLAFALLTRMAFPMRPDLIEGSFVLRLLNVLLTQIGANQRPWTSPFDLTFAVVCILALSLFFWARHQSLSKVKSSDTHGRLLRITRGLFIGSVIIAFLDLLPVLIEGLARIYERKGHEDGLFSSLVILAAIGFVISLLASSLGSFLKTSQHSTSRSTLAARGMTHIALFIAAMALPVLLLTAYLYLSAWSIGGMPDGLSPFDGVDSRMAFLFVLAVLLPLLADYKSITALPVYLLICTVTLVVSIFFFAIVLWRILVLQDSLAVHELQDLLFIPLEPWKLYLGLFIPLLILCLAFKPNAYSLHRFYQDRLSKAFIFNPAPTPTGHLPALNDFKLSAIQPSHAPYHIINAALNIQGSEEANRRGRNADFFSFTRDFLGSDLTLFAPTHEPAIADRIAMEKIDDNLDLGCAMAISGAAVSCNMGANTVRLLSPTLALLNIRLGYWMCNPRHLAKAGQGTRGIWNRWWHDRILLKFYLFLEMFNFLDEKSRNILLTDGGHIENLGIYELLKRGCEFVIAVDAEADPSMSFASFVKLQRYARIDLGVRIELPWEEIAQTTKRVSKDLARSSEDDSPHLRQKGPHCAVGRILYDNGAEGVLLYFKSSLTGDEKDYILDYKKRYPKFPHESTSDQFFTEEQFEVYRSLGFHAVEGFFNGETDFSWSAAGRTPWESRQDAMAAVLSAIPTLLRQS
jgi:hypothetical protein